MTEPSKKRMEEAMTKAIPARYSFYKRMQSLSVDTIELRKRFKEGYQAGMQDPDSNKELLDECESLLIYIEKFPNEVTDDVERIAGEIHEKLKARGK